LKSSPQGRRENIAGLRIQTAANGVNDFVKALPLLAGLRIWLGRDPIKRTLGDDPSLL
jgi:hypothetical protein